MDNISLFKKILAEYEEEEKRKYELANPCRHGKFKPFVWNGQTTCGGCCKHEYKDFLETYDGETTCTLCWMCWPTLAGWGRFGVRVKKLATPKIKVFDENGKNRRVKYHPEPKGPKRSAVGSLKS